MNYIRYQSLKASFVLFVIIVSVFAVLALADGPASKQSDTAPSFVIDDWSHHHLVFSNPAGLPDDVREKITNDRRYQMQQRRRSMGQRPVVAVPDAATTTPVPIPLPIPTPVAPKKGTLKKDWSEPLGSGVAATLTGTVGTLGSTAISGTSMLTVDGVVLDASAPTAASATGTFTGNPTNGQTVTIGGSENLTASLSAPATGSINVGSSFCLALGQGVTVNGTALTTNATRGTGSVDITGTPNNNNTVTVGATTYTFVTSTTPGTNQVHISGSSTTATNLENAINGTCTASQCGTGTSANASVSAGTPSSGNVPLTALCADNSQVTVSKTGSNVSTTSVAAGTAGSNTTTTFALNTSGTTPASRTQTAANILTAVNNNSTSTLVTASSGGTGVVTLTANTFGTVGNAYTLAESATSGFSVSGTTMSGGADGTNTGTSFAIDNVNADAAANLASAITRNGGTVGVTASSAGAGVTVTAATLGTGGNSIGLAETLSNFSWGGSTLANATNGTNSSTTFAYWSVNTYLTPAQVATNIASAINNNATLQTVSTGVSATANTPSNGDVTVTARTVGTGGNSYAVTASSFSAFTAGSGNLAGGQAAAVQPNTYPAKFSFDTTKANCSTDFVVYPTGASGATGVATIIAYHNIYTTGCTGTVPSVYWSYNTGTGDAVTTSPIISFDSTGSQIAFIQSTSTTASLVLLKWAANTSGTLTNQTSGAAYRTCTAPCMYTMAFDNSTGDTFSSPFYDYHGDALYVGDDSGNLHQFTGVFNGAPTENKTSPWPVNLSTTAKLSSPVYDPTWNGGQTYVGDLGGVLHCVTPTGAGCTYGGSVTPTTGGQIADAPLVDGSANYLLAFVNSATSNTIYGYGEQFFPTSPGSVSVGAGATNYFLYSGTFDNVYFQSSNHTGNMYVVGNTGATSGAILYQVGMTQSGTGGQLSGSVAGVVTALTPSGAHPWPSPVSEFCNPGSNAACALNAGHTATTTGTDYIFFSVNQGNKATTYCNNAAGNGCIFSYNVSTPTSVTIAGNPLNVTTPGTNGCWATGGFVIDNGGSGVVSVLGTSQIYFVNLNGNSAGNPTAQTSGSCSAGSSNTIAGVQAAQSNP